MFSCEVHGQLHDSSNNEVEDEEDSGLGLDSFDLVGISSEVDQPFHELGEDESEDGYGKRDHKGQECQPEVLGSIS